MDFIRVICLIRDSDHNNYEQFSTKSPYTANYFSLTFLCEPI